MSTLAVALIVVSSLLVLNLLLAGFVRVATAYRNAREGRLRPLMRDTVARFAVEVSDELPHAFRPLERRILREAMLEAAHELAGDARTRLIERFAERGFVSEAERGLRSPLLLHRVRAAETLGELGGGSSMPALRRGLHDREPLVRFACAHALTRIGAEEILGEVLAALAEGENVFSQGALADVLLESGPDAAQELRALLRTPLPPKQRWLIVVVLGELRAVDAVDDLMRCLEDPDDELCARACHALGKIGDPGSSAALAAICTDGRRPWFVRTAAAGACGQTGDPRVAEALVEALDSEEWYPRNAAAASLVKLGDVGLAAVCRRIGELDPESTLHYWGLLDAANQTERVIVRAAKGERRVRRLVATARRAGATARLEEMANDGSEAGRYAAMLLASDPAENTLLSPVTA
jgi:HEAT repeat protein